MKPKRYPASCRGIALGWTNSASQDRRPEFWRAEAAQLETQFQRYVAPRLADNSLTHLSLFALAPQPLLMRLGHLLSELSAVDVYQRRRDPQTWQWADQTTEVNYLIDEPDPRRQGPPALVFSLSATVTDDRITAVLGAEAAIWRLRIAQPDQDYLRAPQQLAAFRRAARNALDRIKAIHGSSTQLHVFPAMPASTAVEFGRVIQPKADVAMKVYDQQQPHGFLPALMLNSPVTETVTATAA